MQRLIQLFIGPLVGFGVSALITIVGIHYLPRTTVAAMAIGCGLAAVTYFSPTSRRRRSAPFALALGVLVAVLFLLISRLTGTPDA